MPLAAPPLETFEASRGAAARVNCTGVNCSEIVSPFDPLREALRSAPSASVMPPPLPLPLPLPLPPSASPLRAGELTDAAGARSEEPRAASFLQLNEEKASQKAASTPAASALTPEDLWEAQAAGVDMAADGLAEEEAARGLVGPTDPTEGQ